jgi:hypothetical protein
MGEVRTGNNIMETPFFHSELDLIMFFWTSLSFVLLVHDVHELCEELRARSTRA